MAQLTRVAELDARDPRPHRLMGLMYKDFENYSTAAEHYRESLRRDAAQPDNDQILLELADCEIKLRRYDEALKVLSRSAAGPDRWVREAECQYGAGQMEQAGRLLDQTLQADPAQLAALLLYGTIASEQGDLSTAVEAFTRAVVAWPKDYAAHFKLAQALRRSGNDAEADRHAQIADELKRIREEFSKLHERAAADPDDANIRCRLGVLAGELGRPDLAQVWFRAALAIDPQHAETLNHVAGLAAAAAPPPGPQPVPISGRTALKPAS